MSFVSQMLDSLGLSAGTPANALAGFAGALVHIFWYRKTTPFDACGALTGGVLCAIYMGEPAATHTGLPPGLTCFLIGLLGMQGIAPALARLRVGLGSLSSGSKPNV